MLHSCILLRTRLPSSKRTDQGGFRNNLTYLITKSVVIHLYHKSGKICWDKLSRSSWFSSVSWKFSCEYKHLSLIILNNKHFWPKQCASISMKTSMGLKSWQFSPANLSTSTVHLWNRLFYNEQWLNSAIESHRVWLRSLDGFSSEYHWIMRDPPLQRLVFYILNY